MSDALMILPAVTPPPAPAAPASAAKGMAEPLATGEPVKGSVPAPAGKSDTESAERAAAFSEVLACVVSGFVALPKPELQMPVDVPSETLVAAAPGESPRALSLWDLVPVLPAEAADVPAGEDATTDFPEEALRTLMAAEPGVEVPEIHRALMGKTDGAASRIAPAMTAGAQPIDERAERFVAQPATTADAPASPAVVTATAEDVPAKGHETKFAQVAKLPEGVEPAEIKLPREARVVADRSVEPVAPQETLASSDRVVKAAPTQTQGEAAGPSAPARTPKAETARPAMQAEATSANGAKVPVQVADEMTAGPFGTLRPVTSAPERSVAGRQALPDEKAEGVGKDFSEAQRALVPPATETRAADSVERSSEPKTAAASPARQVSDAVQTAQRSGVRVIEMELKPEGMGTLRLRLSGAVRGASAENMRLEIQALDPKAHALLIDNLSELRSALGQWEIRLMPPVANPDFSGVMAGSEGRGYAQSGSQRQHGQGSPERNTRREEADGSFAEQFGSLNA